MKKLILLALIIIISCSKEKPTVQYTLTVNASIGGSVSSFGGKYDAGTSVTITATPEDDYFFSGWEGYTTSYQETLNITVADNISLTANFFQANNCLNGDNDVFNGIEWVNVNEIGNKAYNCLVVNKSDGHPVFEGEESARFELRPEAGDCGYTIGGFSDCDTNRSRHEIYEKWIPEMSEILGKTITYEYSIYIPEVEYFNPVNENGNPLTVLSQIFSSSQGENQVIEDGNSSQCDGKALNYFVMKGNQLQFLTHKPFTWTQNERIIISDNPFNKWFKIKIEIYSSTNAEGYIKLFIDDEFIYEDSNRPTMCSTGSTLYSLKLGIYNSFINEKSKPFLNQVVYYDNVNRTISNQ